jgi:hypothetical protein
VAFSYITNRLWNAAGWFPKTPFFAQNSRHDGGSCALTGLIACQYVQKWVMISATSNKVLLRAATLAGAEWDDYAASDPVPETL